MHCPFCRSTDTRVLDSRVAEDGSAHPSPPDLPGLREAVHHRRADAADRDQAQRHHRAVHPREGHRRRTQGVQGPPGLRGRPGPAGPDRRGHPARRRLRRGAGQRDRPGHPRPAARARRGRLPPLRQRLPRLRVRRGLRDRDRDAPAERSERGASAQRPRTAREHNLSRRADHRPPGAWWGSRAPGNQFEHDQHQHDVRRRETQRESRET